MKENNADKKNRKILWGTVLITMLLSLMFFNVLYYSNNKYMTKEEKAIHGLLYTDDSYEDFPVYYLSREWEYYPDVLLTPEDDLEKYYFRYISIGEYGGMELNDREGNPYGSATYRLRIMIPSEEHTYGLYLPEIFSAYNLYVDGVLMEQVGNPDSEHYVERLQHRMFTFKAHTSVEIMIAVTDKNSASPGIQYVPVFGDPLKVNTQRGIPVFINSSLFTLIFLTLTFSLWAFFRTRCRAYILFAGVCVCVLGYTCYPLLYTYTALSVQPWFSLEMLFCFLTFPAMLLLEYETTGRKYKWIRWTAIFTAIAGIVITLLGIFAMGKDTAALAYGVSWAAEGLKWFTASCLFIIAFFYTRESGEGVLLLFGTVIYAASLAADRIWPLYDPIIGGWFPEWGGTILAGIFGMILCKELTEGYRMKLIYEEQSRQMELRLMMQQEHYEKLTEALEEAGHTRHDLRQYIRTASMLLEQGHYEELKEYFHQFAEESNTKMQMPVCYSKNMSVDAILHYYALQLEMLGVEFRNSVEIPSQMKISDLDICRMFGNLLENAVKAVERDGATPKAYVSCNCKVRRGKLLINIENTYSTEVQRTGNVFYSTSHSGMGIGTASVCKTAKKYGGYADFSEENGIFRANVFIPLDDINSQSS
nr:GHKL domain-containing protein [uncultured Blautia sp.]